MDIEDENISSFGESNSTNTSEFEVIEFNHSELKHSVAYTVVMIVVYSIVFFVGIIGNTVVILVVSLRSEMRTVTNLFVLNLAIADVFVLLFCLPATLIASICKSWILGSFMCWGVAYVQGVSVVASAYSLVAISVDRCKTICSHTISIGSFSRSRTFALIILIWSLAVLVPLPWAFVFELKTSNSEGHIYCTESWESSQHDIFYFIFGNLFCCYVIPFLLISTANVKIWLKVSHRMVPQASVPSTGFSSSMHCVHQIHQRTRRGVGKMLAIVTLTYLFSWLPLYIFATRVKVSNSYEEWESNLLKFFVPLAQWLSYGNSCVNPVFYAFFNSNFREMSKSLLPSWISNGLIESFSPKGRRRRNLQLQEFALNSRFEHGILPPGRNLRKVLYKAVSNGNNCQSKLGNLSGHVVTGGRSETEV